jgi:hypothetical protein
MDPEATQVKDDLRERLEELRDTLLAGNLTGVKGLLPKVEKAHRTFRTGSERGG